MKTPFLHLARRLNTATPAGWFPACLLEATGYTLAAAAAGAGLAVAPRAERLRPRAIASAGALFAAPGYPPLGGLVVLPASDGELPATVADNLRAQLAAGFRRHLDAALADPRLLAHLDLGAPPTSVVGAAGLQFLRDRHAATVGHFLRGPAGNNGEFDATSVCIQFAGLPANLVLWLAAAIAGDAGAPCAQVLLEDDGSLHLLERQRPAYALVH
ncbi:MAG: hypothetical protein ACLGHJ_03660 [Gammaproteobacteria bacterium]